MSIPRSLLTSFALLFVFAPTAHAQEPQRNLYSATDFVRSAAVAGDTLYVGGDFITVGPPTGPAAVLDRVSGEPDLSQARIGPDSFGGGVRVVLPDGQGGWYVGGEIEWAGGEPRRNLAHILADGSLDEAFAPDPQVTGVPFFFGSVEALAIDTTAGVLFVGGRFDTVDGQPRDDLAALNAETGAPLPFSAEFERDGDRPADVEALFVHRGVLYVGGDFDSVNGFERRGAAAFSTQNGALLTWDLQLSPDSFGQAGAFGFGVGPPPTDATLYVGGLFDAVRGAPRPSGSAEVTLADPITGEGGEPTDWTTGFQLGGGPITVAEDVIWRPSGAAIPLFTIDRATGASTGFLEDTPYRNGSAVALDSTGGPEGQGVVYLSAQRDFPGDPFPSRYLVAVDAESGQILTDYFDEGVLRVTAGRGSVGVTSLVVGPGGDGESRLYAGGFDELFGIGPSEPRRFLAGIDFTTGRVTPFNEDFVIFSSVEEVTISPDERFLYFLTFNGLGVADLETGILMDFPGNARAGVRASSTAEAGADSTAGLVRRAGPVVARSDGSPAPAFTPPPAVPAGAVSGGDASRFRSNSAALVASAERLYLHAGGAVVAYDRFTGDELWVTATASFPADPQAEKVLLIQAGPPGAEGDTLFLAGPLSGVGGETRQKFAALDAESGAVLDWNANPTGPPNGVGSGIAALGPPGGSEGGARVYLSGGGLDTIGGEPRDNIAAADRTTGEVLSWTAEPGEDPGGQALAAQAGLEGGVEGGVIYSGSEAYDAESGALLDWNLEPTAGGPSNVVLAARQGRVVVTGNFENSLRGSGHAFVAALSPARPFAPPVSSEDDAQGVPRAAALSAAHPNPFRGTATVTLLLPQAQRVEVALFDVLGRRVMVLHEGPLGSGSHALVLDGSGLGSGVYVVRAQGEGFTAARRVTLVR